MRWLVFDTETTDLIGNSVTNERHQPHIVEFCGLIIDSSGKELEALEFLCRPPIKIPEVAVRITGITDEAVKDEEPFSYYADDVQNFLRNADAVVAHNLSYDMAMVNIEMARVNKLSPWPDRRVCTVEQTEWINGYRLSLTALHEKLFGEGFPDAHRARTDVEATCRCLVRMIEEGYV